MKSKSEKRKELLDPELYFVDQQLIQSVLEHYYEVIVRKWKTKEYIFIIIDKNHIE